MSKFCTTCGATLEDSATFCTTCGASQSAQASAPTASTSNVGGTVKNTFNNVKDKVDVNAIKDSLSVENIKNLKNNPDPKTIGLLAAVAVVAVLILILLINILFGGAYKKPLDNLAKALSKESATAYMKTEPEFVITDKEKEIKKDKDSKYDDVEEYYQNVVDNKVEDLEEDFGKKIKVSYKITDKEKLDKKDLKDCKDILKFAGAKNSVKVTKGYTLEVEVKYKGKDDKDTDEKELVVCKVDGKWCIIFGDFDYNDEYGVGDLMDAYDYLY